MKTAEMQKLTQSERSFANSIIKKYPQALAMVRDIEAENTFININDFARLICVSYSRAKKICMENDMPYYIVDGDYRIKRSDVDRYLESVRHEQKAKEEFTEPLYTIQEVAHFYHVTPSTVEKWIKKGKMEAVRIGGKSIRIKKENINCMLGCL